jgi:hypothetical protein
LAESARHRYDLLTWILFSAAALMILVMAGSLIRSAPLSVLGITMDEIGVALPFGLCAAVVTYILLKPKTIGKPATGAVGRAILNLHGAVLAVAAGMLVAFVIFILTFIPFPLGSLTGVSEPRLPSGQSNLTDLPLFNPVFASSIFAIGVIFVVALIVTFFRMKTETIDDTPDEEMVAKGVSPIPGTVISDEYRKAIIEKYVEGRDVLAVQGIPSSDYTTHREFEKRVLRSAKSAGKDFVPLSRLFEEARFSSHVVGAPQKDEAEKHYEKLAKTAFKQRVEDD